MIVRDGLSIDLHDRRRLSLRVATGEKRNNKQQVNLSNCSDLAEGKPVAFLAADISRETDEATQASPTTTSIVFLSLKITFSN